MNIAEEFSKLSSAKRLQVGCVIVKNDSIIGVGYNGTPTGWDNNCEYEEIYDYKFDDEFWNKTPELLKLYVPVYESEPPIGPVYPNGPFVPDEPGTPKIPVYPV